MSGINTEWSIKVCIVFEKTLTVNFTTSLQIVQTLPVAILWIELVGTCRGGEAVFLSKIGYKCTCVLLYVMHVSQ